MSKVYLAAPWFYGDQPHKLSRVEACLDSIEGLEVFSPRRETQIQDGAPEEARRKTFLANVENIKSSDFIVAIVDDSDKGTLFECGLAYAFGVPILYYSEYAEKKPFNLMLVESCEQLGYVTNIDDLKVRISELLEVGIENMHGCKFKGVVE